MELQVIATGSTGNCYVINHNGRLLLLDAGISWKKIKEGIGYRVMDIEGAIVTHGHMDHSVAVNDILLSGIPVFRPYLNERKIKKTAFGDFSIYSFDVPHDGFDNTGFLIDVGGVRILYATDFEFIKYRFKGVNYFLVEANYDPEIIDEDGGSFSHSILGHASIDTTVDFLKANQSDALKGVILCHLSGRYGDPDKFMERVSNTLNVKTYIAEPGLTVELEEP